MIEGHHADQSLVGIAFAASSFVVMPLVGPGGAADRRPGSARRATASEGKQNLLCAYLAGALLVGLLGMRSWARGGWSPCGGC